HLLLHPKAAGAWSDDCPYIQFKGVRAVLRSPHLQSLRHLRLRLTDLGDKGCEEIVSSGVLKRLETLDLRHGCVTDEGARTLAACPDLKNLEHLDLSRNALTKSGMEAFRAVGIPVALDYQHTRSTNMHGEIPDYLYEGDYE